MGKNEAGRLTWEQWGQNDRQREGIENKYLLNERLNVAFPQVLLFSLCPTLLCLLLGFNCSECYCHWELRYFLFFFSQRISSLKDTVFTHSAGMSHLIWPLDTLDFFFIYDFWRFSFEAAQNSFWSCSLTETVKSNLPVLAPSEASLLM